MGEKGLYGETSGWVKVADQAKHQSHNLQAELDLVGSFKSNLWLKVPGPIASDFLKTFWDFGIRRKLMFFSLLLVNFTAEKFTVWKILMKM